MKTQQNPYETGQALASVLPIQSKRRVTTGLIIGLVVTCVLLATFLLSVVFLFSGPDFSGRRRAMPIQKGFQQNVDDPLISLPASTAEAGTEP